MQVFSKFYPQKWCVNYESEEIWMRRVRKLRIFFYKNLGHQKREKSPMKSKESAVFAENGGFFYDKKCPRALAYIKKKL